MKPKTDYLDPRWQKKRLEILQRDRFTCKYCESEEKTLHVHHKYYIKGRKVWDYHNSALITLCEDCHKDGHINKPKYVRDRIDSIRDMIIDIRDGMNSKYADRYFVELMLIHLKCDKKIPKHWVISGVDDFDVSCFGIEPIDILETAIYNNIKYDNFKEYATHVLMVGELVTAKELAFSNHELRTFLEGRANA